MRTRLAPRSELITRVNVTPIIDVALVLVIILLVTAPLMSVADLPVNLPVLGSVSSNIFVCPRSRVTTCEGLHASCLTAASWSARSMVESRKSVSKNAAFFSNSCSLAA